MYGLKGLFQAPFYFSISTQRHPIIARIRKMLGNVPLTLVSVDIDNLYSPLYKTVWMNGVMTQAYCAQFEYNLDPNAEDDGEYGEFYAIETNPRWNITE